MALPPAPLATVLPDATWVIDATVVEIVSPGLAPAGSPHSEPPEQLVRLRVNEVVFGPALGATVTVRKPEGDYLLRVGVTGPYLLKASKPHSEILGRYGPDTYSMEEIRTELSSGSRS